MNAVKQIALQLEAKLKHDAVPSMKKKIACKLKMLLLAGAADVLAIQDNAIALEIHANRRKSIHGAQRHQNLTHTCDCRLAQLMCTQSR